MVAIFCGKLLAGERPLIFGDGRQTRDYVYVGDIVAANLAAAAHPEAHGAYNIGTGTESTVSMSSAPCAIAAGLGEDEVQPEFAPARTGELQRSSLDVTRARAELGFTADTDLVAGMKTTLEWAREAPGANPARVEPDRPGLDGVDAQVRLAPRIARERVAHGLLRVRFDSVRHAAVVGQRAAEDEEAVPHERVHEDGVLGPQRLLLQRSRAVELGPDWRSTTRNIAMPAM